MYLILLSKEIQEHCRIVFHSIRMVYKRKREKKKNSEKAWFKQTRLQNEKIKRRKKNHNNHKAMKRRGSGPAARSAENK